MANKNRFTAQSAVSSGKSRTTKKGIPMYDKSRLSLFSHHAVNEFNLSNSDKVFLALYLPSPL